MKKRDMKGNNKPSKDLIRKMILDNIPYDEWILARDIAKKLELGSSVVARIISRDLLNVEIERKNMKSKYRGNIYFYRRLNRL